MQDRFSKWIKLEPLHRTIASAITQIPKWNSSARMPQPDYLRQRDAIKVHAAYRITASVPDRTSYYTGESASL